MKEMMQFILLGDSVLIYEEAPEDFWHKVEPDELMEKLAEREENEDKRTS